MQTEPKRNFMDTANKILIVDDTRENIALLSSMLENKDYDLSAASNGELAIKISKHFKPDLILLDIMMPGIDGFETCRQLKKIPVTQDIPIIFISAKVEMEDILLGFEVGGVDYITKPFVKEEVLARIKSQLHIQNLHQELKSAHKISIAASQAKNEFLGKMSHELRTPMHGIISYAQLGISRNQELTPEKNLRFFTNIKDSADRLLLLLNDLLDLQKIESGKMDMHFLPYSIYHIAQQCIIEQEARLNELNIQVCLSSDSYKDIIVCDPERINQVISNLLSNAIKYSSSGNTIDINVYLEDIINEQGETEKVNSLSIKDQGIGIPEHELSKIFNPFTQSSNSVKTVKSTGLGLSICKQIIEAHKGKIWAENVTQQTIVHGAIFKFYIPISQSNINLKMLNKKSKKDRISI